jgi:hypothetical protein
LGIYSHPDFAIYGLIADTYYDISKKLSYASAWADKFLTLHISIKS